MEFDILPVSPNAQHKLFEAFVSALDKPSVQDIEIRGAFAYATIGGIQKFTNTFSSASGWNSAKKRILVGVHNAITEPAGLNELRNLERTEVRAFVPGGRLELRAFAMTPVFHPKVLALVTHQGLVAIQAGSPNLTSAAIGDRPTNYELAVSTLAADAASLDGDGRFDSWWADLWDASRVVNRRFIRQYAQVRQQILDNNPILRSMIETPETIREAHTFFLEVGAASGPPGQRHQVEFPKMLAEFFGTPAHARRDLRLQQQGQVWDKRPLSYKRTTFNVDIWRLGMPTQTSGGPPIAERAIKFTRTDDSNTFDFEVTDVGSRDFATWETSANLSGHLGVTHGRRGRKFGFY